MEISPTSKSGCSRFSNREENTCIWCLSAINDARFDWLTLETWVSFLLYFDSREEKDLVTWHLPSILIVLSSFMISFQCIIVFLQNERYLPSKVVRCIIAQNGDSKETYQCRREITNKGASNKQKAVWKWKAKPKPFRYLVIMLKNGKSIRQIR